MNEFNKKNNINKEKYVEDWSPRVPTSSLMSVRRQVINFHIEEVRETL